MMSMAVNDQNNVLPRSRFEKRTRLNHNLPHNIAMYWQIPTPKDELPELCKAMSSLSLEDPEMDSLCKGMRALTVKERAPIEEMDWEYCC